MSEIHSLYVNRLEQLGVKKQINKTRLKNHLLQHLPEAQAQFDGRNTVLIFKEGMRNMLKDALKKRDFDEDALILAKAAKIIRHDIFSHTGFKFTGSFPAKCQENSLPSSLKSLVSMILNGSNLKDQEKCDSQSCLTIGEGILYNIKKRESPTAGMSRHSLEREPPLPIYIGLNVHTQTRSKKLIQHLHHMGISISYDRVLQLEEWLATSVCEHFKDDGVVAPASLWKGLFTVSALDNLDYNPSSTTSVTSFHGTGISMFQLPIKAECGVPRPPIIVPPSENEKHALPDNYATVQAVALKNTSVSVPECNVPPAKGFLDGARAEEHNWVKHALRLLEKAELTSEDA